ncbi:MAG: hypothetical protein V1725_06245 [archaeon]
MKAQISSLLLVTIVTILTLLVVLLVMSGIFSSTNDAFAYKDCQASVEKFIARTKLTKDYTTASITCRTRTVNVRATDQEQVKRQLAEEMRSCWSTFKQGNVRFFVEEGTYCHPCAIVNFNKRMKPITDFNAYLAQRKMTSSNLTYAAYFIGYSTPGGQELAVFTDNASFGNALLLDPQKHYVVLFHHMMGMETIRQFKERIGGETNAVFLGIGAGGAAAGVVGIILVTAGVVSGPIGWIILGAGMVIGGVIADIWGDPPEWVSSIMLIEYKPGELERLGCQFDEVQQDMFGNLN